ncbi:MAG: SpoIIE family protein phosphatase [Coriobacteriia bacterium]|nr:SpoIIE family protein phosphatase [Coriobacteriia bacterium]
MDAADPVSSPLFPDYFLGMVAELAPLGICVIDGEAMCFRWANRTALQLFGEPFATFGVGGRHVLDVLPEAGENGLLASVASVCERGEPDDPLECDFSRRGAQRDWRWTLRPLGRLRGGPADAVAVVEDVTASAVARARAEEQASRLEMALKRSGSVLASLSAGLAVFDLKGCLIYANQAARDLGVQWDQLVATPPVDTAHIVRTIDGEEVPREEWPLARVLRGQAFTDRWLRRTDPVTGRAYFLSYGGAVVRDDRDKPTLAALTLHDVHDRIAETRHRDMLLETLEREQERSEKLLVTIASERDVLELVMERTDTELAYLDAELRFVTVNEAFARSAGLSRDEMLGTYLPAALPEEVPLEAVREALTSGIARKSSDMPPRVGSPWTHRRYTEWMLTPVPGAPHASEGIVLSLTDITPSVRAKHLSEALNGINLTLSGSLRAEEVLAQLVADVAAALGCDSTALALSDGGGWLIRHVNGLPEELLGTQLAEAGVLPGGQCARLGRPVAVADVLEEAGADPETARRWGVRAALGIPFFVRGCCEAILLCNFHEEPHVFVEAELDFATKLAASASLAFENSHLYESEHHIAQTLQEALLSMPDNVEGVRFGHLYRSAVQAARVGGDFYDVFSLGAGRVGLVVGDVSGKGLEAAALTSLVREAIKAHSGPFVAPCSVLAKVNEVILHNCDFATFVTVFFGILDVQTGHLQYCSAGHPPPVLKRGAEATLLRTRSPLVGALEDVTYHSDGVAVDDGDILLLYTDGLVEVHRGPEMYGDARLCARVASLGGTAVEDVPHAVFMDASAWAGGAMRDDVALLAVTLDREHGGPTIAQSQLPLDIA